MWAYNFIPRSSFHFGERGIGIEETAALLHSDTIWAAVVSAWRLTAGGAKTKVRVQAYPLAGEAPCTPPLRLSSALPYAGTVRFLPRPPIRLVRRRREEAKRVAWVSWRRMADLLENPRPPWVEEEDLLQGGTLWVHPTDRQELAAQFGDLYRFRLWVAGQAGIRPRVTVDRQQSLSMLYHIGQVHFRQGCGFYLLVDDSGPGGTTHRCYLESALHALGELGLGGRRSVGLGQFDIGPAQAVSPPAVSMPEAHLLLSLYHPTRDEVRRGILNGARYELIVRRGWIFSPDDASQRRRGVRMLTEGAVLSWSPTGDMPDLAPSNFPHSVYRSGIALTLPVRRWRDE